jgi:hypothetical protein
LCLIFDTPAILLKLEETIDSVKFEGGGEQGGGFTRDGPYIYTLLGGIGITFETHESLIKKIDDVVAMITDGNLHPVFIIY